MNRKIRVYAWLLVLSIVATMALPSSALAGTCMFLPFQIPGACGQNGACCATWELFNDAGDWVGSVNLGCECCFLILE